MPRCKEQEEVRSFQVINSECPNGSGARRLHSDGRAQDVDRVRGAQDVDHVPGVLRASLSEQQGRFKTRTVIHKKVFETHQ